MCKNYWIWYPGDFEIYQALLQNFSRDERGMGWPAFWYQDDCHKNVCFRRSYELKSATKFTVYSHASGYVAINGKRHLFGKELILEPGHVDIDIAAGLVTGLPAVYIEGEDIHSDKEWTVTAYDGRSVKVGYSERYTSKEQNPSIWEYDEKEYFPCEVKELDGGVLFDFKRELTAVPKLSFADGFKPVKLCYGESVEEAVDTDMCYHSQTIFSGNDKLEMYAFRYIYIPDCRPGEVSLSAMHQYVDIPVRASFESDDELLSRIWNTAKETFRLCSGVFFIDGVKRDRWIWSGDAYQSYMVNEYLFFDEEINKRTILALRGSDPVRGQINTILDYSMYWILSVYDHYEMSGDREFLEMVYPKAVSMMEFLDRQLDEHGFIVGRKGDWIFIDWSDMDKERAISAEQMLLAACYRTMGKLDELMGKSGGAYQDKFTSLMQNIEKFYWSEEKKAYIDSFSSGRQHVTRHANIFAILYGLVDEKRQQLLYDNVLANDAITQITTPYFKFYELEVLCRMGKKAKMLDQIKDYWGGILAQDAVAIWEEYNPAVTGRERFAMYDDPYGKSLCHAWGASPIYLLGRYFLGVRSTATAYGTFTVEPDLELLPRVDATVPVKDGSVHIKWDKKTLTVTASRDGGTLVVGNARYPLTAGETIAVEAAV